MTCLVNIKLKNNATEGQVKCYLNLVFSPFSPPLFIILINIYVNNKIYMSKTDLNLIGFIFLVHY